MGADYVYILFFISVAGGIIIGALLAFSLSDYLSLLLFSKMNKVKQGDFEVKDYCSKPMQVEKKPLVFSIDFTDVCKRSLLEDPEKELDYFTKYCSSKKE